MIKQRKDAGAYRDKREKATQKKKTIYQQGGGDDAKTYQQPDARETERIFTQIWQPRKHN